MAYKLLPGHYSVYVNGVKASNAGTGYGKIATMIIGTLKEDFSIIPLLESGLINPKIPLQPGFDYNLPLNLGIHDKDFTNAEISRFNESYLGFYTPSGPLYYYDQYESSWESWIERLENYKKNYIPNKGRNVVYQFGLDNVEKEIFIESSKKFYLLDESYNKIKESDQRLNIVLQSGKYFIVTESNNNDSGFVTIQGLDPGSGMIHIPELGPIIEPDPEKTTYPEVPNEELVQYKYDESGNRTDRIIYMFKTAYSLLDTVPEIIQNEKNFTYKIYPNPTKGNLYIDFDWNEPYQYQPTDRIEIHDRYGHIIKNVKIVNDRVYIDMTNQNFGIYIMNIVIGNETISWKILKK